MNVTSSNILNPARLRISYRAAWTLGTPLLSRRGRGGGRGKIALVAEVAYGFVIKEIITPSRNDSAIVSHTLNGADGSASAGPVTGVAVELCPGPPSAGRGGSFVSPAATETASIIVKKNASGECLRLLMGWFFLVIFSLKELKQPHHKVTYIAFQEILKIWGRDTHAKLSHLISL